MRIDAAGNHIAIAGIDDLRARRRIDLQRDLRDLPLFSNDVGTIGMGRIKYGSAADQQ
jgi:hypothetical protein